jgi:hypothetical protein
MVTKPLSELTPHIKSINAVPDGHNIPRCYRLMIAKKMCVKKINAQEKG